MQEAESTLDGVASAQGKEPQRVADARRIEILEDEIEAQKAHIEEQKVQIEALRDRDEEQKREIDFLRGLKGLNHEIGRGAYATVFRGAYRPAIMNVRG